MLAFLPGRAILGHRRQGTPPLRLLVPLRSPAVLMLWGGLSLSAVGDQLFVVALGWIGTSTFGALAGLLNALGALCLLATALLAGRWADRWEQRRAMIGADLARAAVLLLAVGAWSVAGAPSAAVLAGVVAVLGAGQAVFRPALSALVPALAEAPALPATNALLDTTERIARLLGPGLVGVLAATLPARHFLTADAGSFLLSAATLLGLARVRTPLGRLPALRRDAAPGGTGRESVAAGVVRGFRVVWRHDLLRVLLLLAGPSNGAWFAALFLGVPLLIGRAGVTGPGGTGLGAFGLVVSAYGCTNLLATLVVGSRPMPVRPAAQVFAGMGLVGAGLALMGLAPALAAASGLGTPAVLPLLCAAAALAAPGGPMQDVPVAVLRQTELPRAEVPAAMRAFMVSSTGGSLLAMALSPLLFSLLPAASCVSLCGAAMVAAAAAGWLLHRRASGPREGRRGARSC